MFSVPTVSVSRKKRGRGRTVEAPNCDVHGGVCVCVCACVCCVHAGFHTEEGDALESPLPQNHLLCTTHKHTEAYY